MMAFTIHGFTADRDPVQVPASAVQAQRQHTVPRRSLVQVRFPGHGMALTYFNDRFDLKTGDRVYVDGKLEGLLGRVTEVCYNFKIKLSDYKKVIAVADTEVNGQFYMAGSHFVTFDPGVLPVEKVKLWFNPPAPEDEEIIRSCDDACFMLEDLTGMNISKAVAERGHSYYTENRVCYLCLDGGKGFAIVEGSKAYTVEFSYRNGEIRELLCDCPCAFTCKHAFAAMLQLRETLEMIEKHYGSMYSDTGYFAAMAKGRLFAFAIDGRETGSLTI